MKGSRTRLAQFLCPVTRLYLLVFVKDYEVFGELMHDV